MKKLLTVVAAFALVLGISFSGPAHEAQAAPSCKYGSLCLWEGYGGSGKKHVYTRTANHNHPIASVYMNYARWGTRFWSGRNGTGPIIAYYHPGDRGFRNWDRANLYRCHSHVDVRG